MSNITENIKENLFQIDIPDTDTVIKEQTEWFKVDLPKKVIEHKKKPDWLRVKLPIGPKYTKLRKLVEENNLHTICTSGSCPNMGECWGEGTATFMILGNIKPEVISHNIETTRRLTKEVRVQAKYDRSMDVLKYMKESGQRRTKSGIMLGLGETKEEVIETIHDLKNAKVDIVTIGQYLQPSKKHLQVQRFVTPDEFLEYKEIGEKLGFKHFESSALVRSSYRARKHIQ